MELYLYYAIPSRHSALLIKPTDNFTFTVHTKIQKHYRKHVLQVVRKVQVVVLQAIRAQRRSRGRASIVLDLSARWRRVLKMVTKCRDLRSSGILHSIQ